MHIKQLERNKYRVWVDLEPDYTGKRKQKSKVFHATSKKNLNAQIDDWVEPDTLVCTSWHWLHKTLTFQQLLQLVHTSAYWCILKKCYTPVTYHPLY